jgi:hypothetical protein
MIKFLLMMMIMMMMMMVVVMMMMMRRRRKVVLSLQVRLSWHEVKQADQNGAVAVAMLTSLTPCRRIVSSATVWRIPNPSRRWTRCSTP